MRCRGRVRRTRRALAVVLLAAGVLAGAGEPGAQESAQGQGVPETVATAALEARRDALFARMLEDPADLDAAFEHAMISVELGDYEGAIASLERMLVFAPSLPRVQLELGVLYFRIGATDTARDYLEAAIAGENVPPAVRDRVNTFLARIDRQERRLRVEGSIQGGVRYQSNANAAPEDDILDINGRRVRLNRDARAQADGNVFGLANVHLRYDLRNQGDLIEADILTYNAWYFDLGRLDTNLIEGTLGPSFDLGRFGLDGVRIGPYGLAGAVGLGGALYSTTYGGGLRVRARLHRRLLWDSRHEIRAVNFDNSTTYPTVRDQTGVDYRNWIRLTGYLSARTSLAAIGETRHVDARTGFESFDEYGIGARGKYLFYVPGNGPLADDAPWSVSLGAGLRFRDYDSPDPFIAPTRSQTDDVYWIDAGLGIPLERRFSVFVNGQLRVQDSNYATRDYTNGIVSVGLSKRF